MKETISFFRREDHLDKLYVIKSPSLFFLFYWAPKRVIATLVSIQKRFMWYCVLNSNKICWVDWNSMCRAKANEGLGVKNLAASNASLLAKR